LKTLLHRFSQTRLAHGFAAVSVVLKRQKTTGSCGAADSSDETWM